MKKFILMFVALFAAFTANAQIATENPKFFDNWSLGIGGGVTSPLDFNSTFPVNAGLGLQLTKDITPVLGLQGEGSVLFNDNNFGRWTSTTVKLTNVGINGLINLNNLFNGYNGKPAIFEVRTNTGLGWLHFWNAGGKNELSAKTGLDVLFNIGKARAITLGISPAIYWNLSNTGRIKFNKHDAQFALMATLTYHFKCSNGKRYFKTYDIGELNAEIARLNAELDQKPKEVIKEVVVHEAATTAAAPVITYNPVYVFFAQNSYELTEEAKDKLDKIESGLVVEVVGSASIEGTPEYNQQLSEKRAEAVANYLQARDIDVKTWFGEGAKNEHSGRVAVINTVE